MLFILFALLAVVSGAFALPTERRSAYNPWSGGFAYAGPGAYASTGMWPAAYWPFGGFGGFGFPWMPIYKPIDWYEGENVCADKKEIEAEEWKEWFNDGTSYSSGDMKHSSKSCQGGNSKMICMERIFSNGSNKMAMTKYECCHGFVRDPYGPGCIEKTDESSSDESTEAPTTTMQSEPISHVRQNDQTSYSFISSSQSRSGVGSVPAQ